MTPHDKRNLYIYTVVSSVLGVVFGFIGPFYIVYIEQISGGMEKLGIAYAIMVLLQSISTLIAGHYSDRLGRKPFLLAAAYVDAVVLFLFTVITGAAQLYVLQGVLGVTNGISMTIRTTLLGDLTVRETRGSIIGRFHAIMGVASAGGLVMSGYLVKLFGLEFLFYIASGTLALSTILLFFLKEDRDGTPQRTEQQ